MSISRSFKILSSALIISMMLGIVSCSNKLPDETLPPATTTTETTVETTESVPETTADTKPKHGPTDSLSSKEQI